MTRNNDSRFDRWSPSRRNLLAGAGAIALWGAAAPAGATDAIEARFDEMISPDEMSGWLKRMAAGPNHVGSPHNKANADWVLQQFRDWGWDARIETFDVLFPTPISQVVELLGPGGFRADLTEPAVEGDASSAIVEGVLPAYVAYQGDGDVTAPLVYVNFGMPDDYRTLQRMGQSVRGKIVIARYGGGWRGLKPKLAAEHGAVGCILYSDPQQDGYGPDAPYPEGGARPAGGVQRGSVADMTLYPGDPLTPGVGARPGAKRLRREDAPTIMKIPVLPISYGQAQRFLAALKGEVAPSGWRGALPITYRIGGGEAPRVRLAVKSDWSLAPAHNVVAVLKGSERPDEWVLRGNHRDAWVHGASDPLSGHVAMLAEAKALGALARAGHPPRRTLVYLSWDAEEPGLAGSTEWVETHAAELKRKAVVYINTDNIERGLLNIEGSHAFERLVNQAAGDVVDPETGVSLAERLRGAWRVAASRPGASDTARARGRAAADRAQDLPLSPLGSGSDYASFICHLGISSLNFGFGGEGQSAGVYHSAYDTWEHYTRFDDPGLAYAGALAKLSGRVVLRLAGTELPPQRYSAFAGLLSTYLAEIKSLTDRKREEALAQRTLLREDLYRLADDPRRPRADPEPLSPVPWLNFAPLDNAIDRLKVNAKAFDADIAAKGPALPAAAKAQVFAALAPLEQALTDDRGLPGRPWYRHLVYAPGRFTGYGSKTLPGVREAVEEERWSDAERYVAITAQAIEAYAAGLDRARRLIAPG